jgi:hypothetical protein
MKTTSNKQPVDRIGSAAGGRSASPPRRSICGVVLVAVFGPTTGAGAGGRSHVKSATKGGWLLKRDDC